MSEENKEKFELKTLEKMFINNEIDNLDILIKKKMEEFKQNLALLEIQGTKITKDKDGNEKEVFDKKYKNPVVLSEYLFKSVNPYKNMTPEYTAESLNAVFNLYCEILAEVNAKIGTLAPSISSFCKFAGISSTTFKGYKSSPEDDLRNLIDVIEDYCYDTNVAMSQNGFIKERSTVYRMKSEQEKMEKEQQKVIINAKSVNIGEVQEKIKRIQELQKFNNKNRLIEADFEETEEKENE